MKTTERHSPYPFLTLLGIAVVGLVGFAHLTRPTAATIPAPPSDQVVSIPVLETMLPAILATDTPTPTRTATPTPPPTNTPMPTLLERYGACSPSQPAGSLCVMVAPPTTPIPILLCSTPSSVTYDRLCRWGGERGDTPAEVAVE